ncbi:MAG: hypothetical protein LH624_00915 [Cryobacterium sp.]|nr:hypothetical protein [Cryobacterium sp.]
MDEPTASLDRRWADKIMELIFHDNNAGRAVLVASHDESVALASGVKIHIESLPHGLSTPTQNRTNSALV